MNIRYSHEFKGMDNILNRFEILTENTVKSIYIEGATSPFTIDYSEARKLEPVRGSQATIELISKSIFQFVDLHTGNMQKYLVKFYRADILYWVGWLDPEIYGEELSATPPYGVIYKASDFNILERLKYLDDLDKAYTDIVPFTIHLKRCLSKLGLPFQKLYIGCTTSVNGISISPEETALHVLYMMSSNFYDEDNEPMQCREVIENILRPLGLMMVQINANVYIYDYNTVKNGLAMKRYNFPTFTYETDEIVLFNLGEMAKIGFMSTDSSYSFEEMINNVNITSSLYASTEMTDVSVNEENVSDLIDKEESHLYRLYNYSKCKGIESVSGKFTRYNRIESYIEGCYLPYLANPSTISPVYRIKIPTYLIGTDATNFLNVKLQVYVNTRDNPFNDTQGVKNNANAGTIKLHCNLYTTDEKGKILKYCNLFLGEAEGRPEVDENPSRVRNYWIDSTDGTLEHGKCGLWISNEDVASPALDNWITNADYLPYRTVGPNGIQSNLLGDGVNIGLNQTGGYVVFEITNKCRIVNSKFDNNEGSEFLLPESMVKHILINNIEINVNGKNSKKLSTDDYEFKSYIDKKVATDLEEVTLKCISANEEKSPMGKANILKKIDNRYELQLSYTRAGQTDILERLLMCTIHSNFTTKNEKVTVDIKMTDNPALSYVSYQPILSGSYLITGCTLNFAEAKTTIIAVGYSEDTAKLSNIPYE